MAEQTFTETIHLVKNSSNEAMIGILRQCANETASSTSRKPILILCHGLACHKNYLIFPKLFAEHFDTFRFDFSGNGESEGEFSYANYYKEVEDLHSVVLYLKDTLKYEQISLCGHSKGGNVVLLYSNKYPQELQKGIVVNLCGRFDMSHTPVNRFSEGEREELAKNGRFLWKTFTVDGSLTVSGSDLTKELYVTKQALEEREKVDTKIQLQEEYPLCIYSIHGDRDSIISFSDSQQFHEYIKNQIKEKNLGSKCSHELIPIDGSDHFYVGFYSELQNIVTQLMKESIQLRK